MSVKCCHCGRFCGWEADSSTPFGDSTMMEPPDPDFYCDKCAAEQRDYYIGKGWVPSDWRKARWQREAATALGLVEVGSKGAAWSVFKAPDKIPDGYV